MMVIQLGVVEIGVHDMDQARQFYCDLLGFSVETEEHLPDYLVLEHRWPKLVLYRTAEPAQIDYPHQAQALLAFYVEGLNQLKEKLVAAGVPVLHAEPQNSDMGNFIAVRDPSGNIHELYEGVVD